MYFFLGTEQVIVTSLSRSHGFGIFYTISKKLQKLTHAFEHAELGGSASKPQMEVCATYMCKLKPIK